MYEVVGEYGVLPSSLCKTNVVLISKFEMTSTMKDLSPISLYNVVYKILAKVFVIA